MIRIGMCDDDLSTLNAIAKMVESQLWEQDFDAEITCITSNQKEVFDLIYKREIDILFLDIDFKGKGKQGIDFALDLRNINREFMLIFVTAHQRFMHTSFPAKTFDYLLKPINMQVLEDLVHRIKIDCEKNKIHYFHLNKWIYMRTNDIFYIEKVKNKSKIVTSNKIEYTTKTLETLLNELPSQFLRCHKSFILNENQISILDKKEHYAYFPNNLFCPISSHFKLSIFYNYLYKNIL